MNGLQIGRSIRAIRIRLGWRQADRAAKTGDSRSFISKVERGLIGTIDLDRLERICRELGAIWISACDGVAKVSIDCWTRRMPSSSIASSPS